MKYVIGMYASANANSDDEQESAAQKARKYIGKMEMQTGRKNSEDPANCKAIIKKLDQSRENTNAWIINPCRFVLAIQNVKANGSDENLLTVQEDPLELKKIKSVVARNPRLTFYLYSGANDSFEPSELFVEESLQVKEIKYTDFLTSGHECFITEPQVWKDLSSPL